MKSEKKIMKLKKTAEKELKNSKNYQEMKKAFSLLEQVGIRKEPRYNLQTIENMGSSLPVFTNIENQ